MSNKIILLEELILQVLCLNVPINQRNEIDKIVKKLRELKREYLKKYSFTKNSKHYLKHIPLH